MGEGRLEIPGRERWEREMVGITLDECGDHRKGREEEGKTER